MQNQNIFLKADELSNPNKKYSIPTKVVAVPSTAAGRKSFRIGTKLCGIVPVRVTSTKSKNNIKDKLAARR